jgi:hypothetical protein
MSQYFLDSSALVKRYRQEVGSTWMLELFTPQNQLIVARLSHIEVAAAIVRRSRQSGQLSREAEFALSRLDNDMRKHFQVVEFSETIISLALGLVRLHSLRAADAIQLASAKIAGADISATGIFLVSADDELNAAAKADGLRVENPSLYTQ